MVLTDFLHIADTYIINVIGEHKIGENFFKTKKYPNNE